MATASCSGTLLSVHPSSAEKGGNDAMLGATTTLLVCRANWVASAEYQDLSPMKPCCSQMTPVA